VHYKLANEGDRVYHPIHGEGVLQGFGFYDLSEAYVFFYKSKKSIKTKIKYLSQTYAEHRKKVAHMSHSTKYSLEVRADK
jgi:hypothetical protein